METNGKLRNGFKLYWEAIGWIGVVYIVIWLINVLEYLLAPVDSVRETQALISVYGITMMIMLILLCRVAMLLADRPVVINVISTNKDGDTRYELSPDQTDTEGND